MVQAQESITIARTCEDVFAVLTDLSRMPLWRANLARAEWVGDDPPGIGAGRIAATTQLIGVRLDWTCDVTAWDPPSRFAYTARNRSQVVEVDFRLEREGEGCRLTMSGGGDVPGGKIGAVAAPLYIKALLRENRKSLSKLKLLVERNG